MNEPAPTIVDFELCANLITLDVALNGQPMEFVLDTGAGATVIDAAAAKQLGLQEVRKHVGCGAGGTVEMSVVDVDSIAVGAARIEGVAAMVTKLDDISARIGKRLAGVLGFDFLSRFRITLDYRQQRLVLEPNGEPTAAP